MTVPVEPQAHLRGLQPFLQASAIGLDVLPTVRVGRLMNSAASRTASKKRFKPRR